MKKINCIQQYIIDSLIKENKLSVNSLIDATSKVCSHELLNNILAIIIESSETNDSLTAVKKSNEVNETVEKEKYEGKTVVHLICTASKLKLITGLKNVFRSKLGLKECKDIVDTMPTYIDITNLSNTERKTLYKILIDTDTEYSIHTTQLMQ